LFPPKPFPKLLGPLGSFAKFADQGRDALLIELADIGKWRGHWEHKGTAVLMSLPIHVLSITDPFHKNELDPVRDLIDHSIGPDPDAVERKAAGQLYTTFGSWVGPKSFQSDQDLSVIRFRDLSQITCGRSRQLYGI